MIAYDFPQRSPDWCAVRVGMFTASRAADMLASIKSGEAAARRDLRVQLVVERLTQQAQDDVYVNAAMEWGLVHEDEAFAAYEALTGNLAQRVGFVRHDTLRAGCSPDGVLDDYAGVLELKCPKSATHLRYLQAGVVPSDYRPQILHTLWITGARWCDFVSYDPRFPAPLRVFHVRMERSDPEVLDYQTKARTFLEEVDAQVAHLEGVAHA